MTVVFTLLCGFSSAGNFFKDYPKIMCRSYRHCFHEVTNPFKNIRPVISQDFSWFQDVLQISQGMKGVACFVSQPLVSCLWGCGESVNPPKLNIQDIQGALSSRPKGDPGLLPIFQDLLLLSNHNPEILYYCTSCVATLSIHGSDLSGPRGSFMS